MEDKQEGRWDAWAMGTPALPQAHTANQQGATWVPVDYIPSSSSPRATAPASCMNYSVPPSAASAHVGGGGGNGGDPYVHVNPVPGFTDKSALADLCQVIVCCH